MKFLRRKAEELKKKGIWRVQGTHPIPGTKSRTETTLDDTPARKKPRLDIEDRVVKVARRRLEVDINTKQSCLRGALNRLACADIINDKN